jgi:hypothetical protein
MLVLEPVVAMVQTMLPGRQTTWLIPTKPSEGAQARFVWG